MYSVCFSSSGDYLTAGGMDSKVAIVSTSTWEVFLEVEREFSVYSLSFGHSGKLVAVGEENGKVAVLSIDLGSHS